MKMWVKRGFLKGWHWLWENPKRLWLLAVSTLVVIRWAFGFVTTDEVVKIFTLLLHTIGLG